MSLTFLEEQSIHEQLKLTIFNNAHYYGYTPKFEKKIGTHRPDILLHSPNIKIAIECQCSPININEYIDRNNTYEKNGYYPCWIFAGQHFYNITTKNIHVRGYQIQRIHEIHEFILQRKLCQETPNKLLTYGQNHFLEVTKFKYRWNAEKLGWYYTKPIFLKNILGDYA